MRIVACCVVLMLTAVVASGAQTAPAGSGKIDACAFLTKEDAAAALGEAVTKGPRAVSTPNGAAACEYYEGSGLHRIHLNVIPLTAASAGMYKIAVRAEEEGRPHRPGRHHVLVQRQARGIAGPEGHDVLLDRAAEERRSDRADQGRGEEGV